MRFLNSAAIPLAAALASFSYVGSGCAALMYTYNNFNFPGGVGLTEPEGINDLGQVAGNAVELSVGPIGFYRDANGNFTTFAVPNSPETLVSGLNNAGQIIGSYGVAGTLQNNFPAQYVGFIYSPAANAFTFLTDPDSRNLLFLTAINNNGQIIGGYYVGSGFSAVENPFLRQPDGALTAIGKSGVGINDAGQIVGTYLQGTYQSGTQFRYIYNISSATLVSYADPAATGQFGSSGTVFTGINDVGQVIGNYRLSGQTKGFILDLASNTYTDLTDPIDAYADLYPTGINNLGQITGYYADPDNNTIDGGFIATPVSAASVDEPSTLLLLCAGLGLVGACGMRGLTAVKTSDGAVG